MKRSLLLSTLACSVLLSSVASQAQTQGIYERGMAEARIALRDSNSQEQVGRLYSRYIRESLYQCQVTFAFSQGLNVVYAPFKFVGNLTWGIMAGKEVIRMTTGDQGQGISPQLKQATGAVTAMFAETNDSINGKFGSCTLATAKMQLAREKYNAMSGQDIKTMIEVDNKQLPVIVVPNEISGKKM